MTRRNYIGICGSPIGICRRHIEICRSHARRCRSIEGCASVLSGRVRVM